VNKSLLWNGFEIKKNYIETEVGKVPFMAYIPEYTNNWVNIAIHGEGFSKEEWLSFISVSKFGNLLKESIKMGSPFIAFDLYGHGDWEPGNKHFYGGSMEESEEDVFNNISSKGISKAIDIILEKENLTNAKIALTAFYKGCSVALNLTPQAKIEKMILISPRITSVNTTCTKNLILTGTDDPLLSGDNLTFLLNKIPGAKDSQNYNSDYQIPESWIHKTREFIYS
jgi:predicted esterase